MFELYQLVQKQSLPLESKVRLAIMRIRAWYMQYEDEISLLIDGSPEGKVLRHIALDIFPETLQLTRIQPGTITPFMVGIDKDRINNWLEYGCNAFELDPPQCRPLSTWFENDVDQYLHSVFP